MRRAGTATGSTMGDNVAPRPAAARSTLPGLYVSETDSRCLRRACGRARAVSSALSQVSARLSSPLVWMESRPSREPMTRPRHVCVSVRIL